MGSLSTALALIRHTGSHDGGGLLPGAIFGQLRSWHLIRCTQIRKSRLVLQASVKKMVPDDQCLAHLTHRLSCPKEPWATWPFRLLDAYGVLEGAVVKVSPAHKNKNTRYKPPSPPLQIRSAVLTRCRRSPGLERLNRQRQKPTRRTEAQTRRLVCPLLCPRVLS